MNREQFEKAMNGLDDRYVKEAVEYKGAKKRGRIIRIGSLAACAVVVMVGVIGLVSGGTRDKSANRAETSAAQANGYYFEDGDYAWTEDKAAAAAEAPAPADEMPAMTEAPQGIASNGIGEIGTVQGRQDNELATQQNTAKIIYSASINLESQDFDGSYEMIDRIVSDAGGYYEDNSVYDQGSASRTANLVIRLPQEQFDAALARLKEVCHVTYANQTAQNISEEYYDVQSRLETAKIKLDRLQALLAEAKEMSDIIELENAISSTQWEVDYLSGSLRHYDSLVGYSTIRVSLNEVQILTDTDPEPISLGARIKNAFLNGLEAIGDGIVSFVLWFVSNIIWIALIAAAVITSVVIIKKKRRVK